MMDEKQFEAYCNFINNLLYDIMTLDDYESVIESLGVPSPRNGRYKTFCHNHELHSAHYNLSFKPSTRGFYCNSECNCSYNLLTLLEKHFDTIGQPKTRFQCVKYICDTLSIPFDFSDSKPIKQVEYNWRKGIGKYVGRGQEQVQELKIYDDSILNHFPKLYHQDWIDYGISEQTLEKYNIRYYPYRQQIVIPAYTQDNQLCGIRIRNTIEDVSPKYCPLSTLNNSQYNFPTGQVFYGENHNIDEIKRTKKVILCEAEKTVLKMDTWFGKRNISLGLYGSNLTKHKLLKLISYEVSTVYIAIDSDFNEIGDDDFKKFEEKVFKMADMLRPYIPNIYVVYNNLGYKDAYKYSLTDFTREQFNELWKSKEMIE